jgi:ribonuclease BN (tRNA processing enzyme)
VKPLFHPRLVNDPFGDPGLYIDFLFDRRALLLFDLGDLSPLSARQLLKVSHAFVSHTHMDHFAGFDTLLRLLVPVRWSENGSPQERTVSLGELKEKALRIVPGQKIAYVTDAGYTPANAEAIVDLARNADWLFIETAFTHEEEQRAAEKYHLTARQAGWLARKAGAKRLVPFHFSPKHTEEGDRLVSEAMAAFEEGE